IILSNHFGKVGEPSEPRFFAGQRGPRCESICLRFVCYLLWIFSTPPSRCACAAVLHIAGSGVLDISVGILRRCLWTVCKPGPLCSVHRTFKHGKAWVDCLKAAEAEPRPGLGAYHGHGRSEHLPPPTVGIRVLK